MSADEFKSKVRELTIGCGLDDETLSRALRELKDEIDAEAYERRFNDEGQS